MAKPGTEPLESMTAFASRGFSLAGRAAQVSLRSVNHRGLRLQVRADLPSALAEELEALLRGPLKRGSVEFHLDLEAAGAGGDPDEGFAAWRASCQAKGLPAPGWADWFARQQLAGRGREDVFAGPEAGPVVLAEARLLLVAFLARRREEGARLGACLAGDLSGLEAGLASLRRLVPEENERRLERYRVRLADLAAALEPGARADLARECAVLLERLDTGEELDRLAGHLEAFGQSLREGREGRYLDFLCQEIHRELTTLANKAQAPAVSEACVGLKVLAEKMREQVQNLA